VRDVIASKYLFRNDFVVARFEYTKGQTATAGGLGPWRHGGGEKPILLG